MTGNTSDIFSQQTFGLTLTEDEKRSLIAFLRTL